LPVRSNAAMRAAMRDRYGPPEVVEVREVEKPAPTGDEVLVRVHVASVNRADLDAIIPRWAFIRLFAGLRAPRVKTVGLDVAGVVEAVGPEATRFKPGDRVFGDMFSFGSDAFADYVCASERAFLPIPDGMAFDVAATLPHSAVLAMQALRNRRGRTILPGDRVLIDGASGNVGPFAVQIAKAVGAEVTGTASTPKLDFVRSLGADHVIDYTTTDYTRSTERYDWIVDVDSHKPVLAVRRVLKPGGVYVTCGGAATRMLGAVFLGAVVGRVTGRSMGLLLWWKPFHPEDVARLTALVQAGEVTPAIDSRYPLDDVAKALRHVNDGRARGKVLVTVAEL
jgi:NADPH:quinone reductase-like Zn-dependent oxidoreductase